MNEASTAFTNGKYTIDPIRVVVTDGKLTIGVANTVNTNLWCIWDNFKLLDYGGNATSFITNPSFENNLTGWTNNGFQAQANTSLAKKVGTLYCEKWQGSGGLPNSDIHQEVSLPNGTYSLAVVGAFGGDGLYLYAGSKQTQIKGEEGIFFLNDIVVTDEKLTIGVKLDKATANWARFDDFQLNMNRESVDNLKAELTQKLAVQINKAGVYTEDETLQKLGLDASQIQVRINNFGDDVTQYYTILADIDAAGEAIAKAAANYEAYAAALDGHAALETYLQTLTTVYNKAAEETQVAAKTLYEGVVKQVADFKAAAETAYKANTAASEFSSENIKKKSDNIKAAIDAAKEAIQSGSDNAFSYANVVAEITNAKNQYNDEAARLYDLLAGATDGSIYTDTYVKALSDLNNYSRDIANVEKENKAKYDAGEANADTQTEYLAALAEAEAGLPTVYNEYESKVGTVENPAEGTLRSNYIVACADVKTLTDKLAADVTTPISTPNAAFPKDNRPSVTAAYQSAIDAIKQQIADLQANVNAANKAHTIAAESPYCENYQADKTTIEKAISDLKAKTDKAIAEYDANNATLKAIADLQTAFNNASTNKNKTGVHDLKSTDGKYTTNGRFGATETAIQNAIDALTEAAKAAYKVDGTGTAQKFNTENLQAGVFDKDGKQTTKGVADITNDINNYLTAAQNAITAYNAIAAALVDYDAKLNGTPEVKDKNGNVTQAATPGLVGTATNKDVTIDAAELAGQGKTGNDVLTGKSYATAISEYAAAIAKIQAALNGALTLSDGAHVDSLQIVADQKAPENLTAITIDPTISTAVKNLETLYPDNETAWNEAQLAAAKARLLAEAERRVGVIQLPADYDADTFGLKYKALNTQKDAIQTKLTDQNTKIGNAKASTDDAEAIALLAEIQQDLVTIEADYNKLLNDASSAKEAYEAEKLANVAVQDALAEVSALLNGGTYNEVEYKSIAQLLAPDVANRFDAEVQGQQSLINAVTSNLAASFAAETVRADRQDVKDKDGKVTTPGFDNRIVAIKSAVNQLRTLAANESDNATANNTFEAAIATADVPAAITAAKNGISEVATGAGLTFFNSELQKYQNEYKSILSAQVAANEARIALYGDSKKTAPLYPGTTKDDKRYTDTSKNMVKNLSSLQSRLANVKANIEGLKALAEANEKAHNDQVAASKSTLEVWDDLFAEITNDETSTAHEAAIATLAQAKNDLAAYDKAVSEAFAAGKSDTNKSALEEQLTKIDNALKQLADGWNDTYKAAIAADNATRKEAFDAAYKTLTESYTENVNLITMLSKLSYASGPAATQTLLDVTGEGGIYEYAGMIRQLKADANADYQATSAPALFDAEEAWKQKAEKYQAEVEDLAKTYTDEVNTIALATYQTEYKNANQKYEAAVTAIKEALGYSDKDARAAVADVKTILDNAEKSKNAQDFAYILDNTILPNFATIDTKLAADKETAAATAWNSNIGAARTLAAAEAEAIAKFVAEDGTLGAYTDSYADFVANSIDKAATAWGKIKAGEKFANYSSAYNILNNFIGDYDEQVVGKDKNGKDIKETHTSTYWAAYDEDQAYHSNDLAYIAMRESIQGVQDALAGAKDYVGSLLVEHNDNLNDRLNTVQSEIDGLTAAALFYSGEGIASANKAIIENACNTQLNAIEGIIASAIDAEEAAISVEIGQLMNDYDKATAADIENEEIDKYKDIIAGYTKENAAIARDFQTGKVDEDGLPIYEKDKNGNDDTTKPVKATAEETHAAYLALEKAIGQTKYELAEIYDKAASATAQQEVQTAIDGLQATYDALTAQLADCHEPVVDTYQGAVDELKAAIEAAQAELDQEVADKTVLLYAENNLTSAAKVADVYVDLDSEIASDEAPYDINDAKYAELTDVLDKLDKALADVNAAAAEYKYQQVVDKPRIEGYDEDDNPIYKTYKTWREYSYAEITAQIKDWRDYVDAKNAGYKLKASDKIGDVDDMNDEASIKGEISVLEQDLAFYNASNTVSAVSAALTTAYNTQRIKKYTVADESALNGTYSTLHNNVSSLTTYNYNANSLYVYSDINGVKIENVDENGNITSFGKEVVYMEEYPAIMDRAAELAAEVEAYAKDVEDKSYIKGDVDHNGKVNVADYSAIRNIALDITKVEPTDSKFYAADVNGDGEVTIADVTGVASYIMSGNTTWPWTNAAKSRFATADNSDAISIAAIGTGTKQQIVIALAGTKSYVGAQMDIVLPEGVKVVGESLTSRANGHELLSNDLENGAHRVLISTIENNEFLNTEVALLVLDVEVSAGYSGGQVAVENAIFTDAAARSYRLGSVVGEDATGITELTATEKVTSTIYSVGGQLMNALKKGINIIRHQDGTTEKVLVK